MVEVPTSTAISVIPFDTREQTTYRTYFFFRIRTHSIFNVDYESVKILRHSHLVYELCTFKDSALY